MTGPTLKDGVLDALRRERFALLYADLEGQKPSGGAWVSCRCPFHEDRENFARFNLEDAALECFAGCRPENGHAQFSPFDVHMRRTGQSFADALRDLADKLGIDRKADRRPQSASGRRTAPGTLPENRNAATGAHSRETGIPGEHPATVDALAADKGIDADFLRGLGLTDTPRGVEIPYRLPEGTPAPRTRLRSALKAKDGSRWLGKGDIVGYGLDRLADARAKGALVLVEGETDCWALWAHGVPALGLPGANTARLLQADHLDGIKTLYVHQEPDAAGAAFVEGVCARLHEIGFAGEARCLSLPGHKDPSDAARALGADFLPELRDACREARDLDFSEPPRKARSCAAPDFAAPKTDAVEALRRELEDEANGKRRGVPLPFAPRLYGLAQPTRPGTLTVLAGPQGSTKSYLALNACLASEAAGASWRYLPLEGTHRDYCRRAVAILDGCWDAVEMPENEHEAREKAEKARAALDRHADALGRIAPSICEPPALDDPDATHWERVAAWARSIMETTRLVVVDSLHFIGCPGRERHRDQEAFVGALQSAAQRTGATCWLIAHTVKRDAKSRRAPLGPDDVQGGAGLIRAADCILIVNAHERRETSVYRYQGLRESVDSNRTIFCGKTRHAKGDGDAARVAFDFGSAGPRFAEQGVIARDE